MFVVEARRKGELWILGIFLKEQDKDAFMKSVPPRLKRIQTVVEVPRRRYPLYIIEDFGKSFEYVTKKALVSRIRHIRRVEDKEVEDKEIDVHVKFPRGGRTWYVVTVSGKSRKYRTKKAFLARVSRLREDTDQVYFNYYAVNEDYSPEKPGTDYMGRLHHVHVDNSFLKHYADKKRFGLGTGSAVFPYL